MRCPNCLSGDRPICRECGKPWLGQIPSDPGASMVAVKASELEELVEAARAINDRRHKPGSLPLDLRIRLSNATIPFLGDGREEEEK